MKWVIEDGVFPENQDELSKLTQSTLVKYRPFDESKQLEVNKGLLPQKDDNKVIFYGSINLGRKLIKQGYAWQIWLPDKVFDCSYWLPRFEKFCFNTASIFSPFGLFSECLKSTKLNYCTIFVRPDSGYKLFDGQVVRQQERQNFLDSTKKEYNIFPEDMIMISLYGEIDKEFRFLIGNFDDENIIISGSQYISEGKVESSPDIPEECYDFVKDILAHANRIGYNPAPAWTLDICYNGSYWMLETGSFSSAGLYQCNMKNTVKQIEKICKEILI